MLAAGARGDSRRRRRRQHNNVQHSTHSNNSKSSHVARQHIERQEQSQDLDQLKSDYLKQARETNGFYRDQDHLKDSLKNKLEKSELKSDIHAREPRRKKGGCTIL